MAPGGMSLRIDASLAAGVQRGWRPCPACVLQAEAQNSHVPARADSGGRGGHPAHSPGSTARGPPRRRESGTVRAPQGPEGRALGLAPPASPTSPSPAVSPASRDPGTRARPAPLPPQPFPWHCARGLQLRRHHPVWTRRPSPGLPRCPAQPLPVTPGAPAAPCHSEPEVSKPLCRERRKLGAARALSSLP